MLNQIIKIYISLQKIIQLKTMSLVNKQILNQKLQQTSQIAYFMSNTLKLNCSENQFSQNCQMEKTQIFLNLTDSPAEINYSEAQGQDSCLKSQSENWETVDQNSCSQDGFNKKDLADTASSDFPKINKDILTMGESDQESQDSLSYDFGQKLNLGQQSTSSVISDKNKMKAQNLKHRNLSLNKKYEDEEDDYESLRSSNAFLKEKLAKMMELLYERTSQLQKKQMKIKKLQNGIEELKQQNNTLEAQKKGLLKLIM